MSDLIRVPYRAGSFYPSDPVECLNQVKISTGQSLRPDLPENIFGGIVPHAGWAYSGKTAGSVFRAIKHRLTPETFILLGTTHYYGGRKPVIYDRGNWQSPIGDLPVDESLSARISEYCSGKLLVSREAHEEEHSIEVQLPFVKYLFPEAKIVPILVPPVEMAVELGTFIGEVVSIESKKIVIVGSTDLTHYGSRNYGFAPAGIGKEALRWSKDNDLRVIRLMLALKADEIIEETHLRHNACGPGAIATTIAAVKKMGASHGYLIEHTTSCEVELERTPTNFVGYAGVVF